MADVVSIEDYKPARARVTAGAGRNREDPVPVVFDRHELDQILQVYGRKVVAGEWRDYALSFDSHCASFSVIARASRGPQYRIVKWQNSTSKRGAYSVVSPTGRILSWGRELAQVLKLFEGRKLLLA